MTQPQPTVGRIVHYVAHGTPIAADGTQAYPSACVAAIVTEVPDAGGIGLCALYPEGMSFKRNVEYDEGAEKPGSGDCPTPEQHGAPFRYCSCGWWEASLRGGTWHWPERA